VSAKAAKVMQIDASPWTPKFYGGLYEALFASFDDLSGFEEQAKSNLGQTHKFLATLRNR
jgi:hypothetical protein